MQRLSRYELDRTTEEFELRKTPRPPPSTISFLTTKDKELERRPTSPAIFHSAKSVYENRDLQFLPALPYVLSVENRETTYCLDSFWK